MSDPDAGNDAGTTTDAGSRADAGIDSGVLGPIPADAYPCEEPEHWNQTLRSTSRPVLVHYRPGEDAVAAEVLGYIETSWRVLVDEIGFSAPLTDEGHCGPDDAFDVYLWRGAEETYVDAITPNEATPHNDWFTYMVVDPYGDFGGELLDATIAHELSHACQATDDWWDTLPIFEMTSTFVEDLVYDDDDSWKALLVDFQSRPDHSLDRDDDYETWYMYAAGLYLHFLAERYFAGDPSFAADMWRASRGPPGAEDDPLLNEPDFEDALEMVLQSGASVGFHDSVAEFARWRWFVASRDDGAHFAEGASFPRDAEVPLAGTLPSTPGRLAVSPAPMMLGNAYVQLTGTAASSVTVSIESAASDVRWVVQAIPGLDGTSDGEVLAVPGPVVLGADGTRILVLTVLPAGADDPDERTDDRFDVTIVIE